MSWNACRTVTAEAGRDREVNVPTSPIRIFVKTQFNGTGASSILLSIGLVSDSADECYVELPPKGLHLAGAPPEILNRVVSQFGRVPGARVDDRIGMSDRVAGFLNLFAAPIALSYDCKVDLSHLQTLVSQTREVFARIRMYDIAKETSSPTSKQAWSDQLKACSSRRIGGHHALAEALALKAAWFATPT